ncbi:hypothetical protein D3C81_391460 [compost metagenome]
MAIGAVLVPVVPAKGFPAPVQVVVIRFVVLVGTAELRIVAMQTRFPVALLVMCKGRFGQLHQALTVKGHVVLA